MTELYNLVKQADELFYHLRKHFGYIGQKIILNLLEFLLPDVNMYILSLRNGGKKRYPRKP